MESFGVKLTWLGCKHLNFVRPSLLFTIPTGTDKRTRNRCNKHRWSELLMPFRESRNTNKGKQI